MDVHNNARLTPKGREAMVRAVVEGGLSKAEAARRFHTTPKTVSKWVARFRSEGIVGLWDRSSRPHSRNILTCKGSSPKTVPLVLPRSRTSTRLSLTKTSQWRLDTNRWPTLSRTISEEGKRPMITGFASSG